MSAPPADLDAEREIDLSGWRDSLVRRWWVVAACTAAGVVVGALFSLSGGSVQEASVLIAPGQVFSPGGGVILTIQSSPRGINEIVTSTSAIERAAAKAGMPVSELRGHVRTETVPIGIGSTASRGSQLIRVTVTGHRPRKIEDAADALGEIVRSDTTGAYVEGQIKRLQGRVVIFNSQLEALEKVIDGFNSTIASEDLAPLDKLVLVNQLDAAIQRQGNLNDKVFSTEQQLTLLNTIEIAQIVSHAAAQKTTARSRRNSILVGALIGLIVGVIAAIVVDRRAGRSAAQ